MTRRELFSLGRIRRVDDGAAVVQRLQADFGPKLPDGVAELVNDLPRVAEYGLASSPPLGSEAIVLFLSADRSQGLVVGTHYKGGRPTGLAAGESALFNAVTGAVLLMKADGKAHMNCDLAVDGAITATGEITARVNATPAALGAVRDAYHDHKHPETGTQTGPSDHLSV